MRPKTRPLASAFVLAALALASPVFPASNEPAPAPQAAAEPTPGVSADYRQEIEAWRKEREAGLREEDSWFSLVGLFWLREGENRFGSGVENTVILPEGKAPEVAGLLIREGEKVKVRVSPGAAVTTGGEPVTEMDLRKDVEGDPTVLELGSLSFFAIQRGERIGVRVKDAKSEALASFHGLHDFPIDPAWRVEARFEPYEPPKPVSVPNVLGDVSEIPSPGAVVFERDGKTWRLDALPGSPEGEMFLIFGDATNGRETYGAGRFLVTGPVQDGKVVVDFNKAYNPPCAYSAYATCPLPPKQNEIALAVTAGEKKYGDH
jgi:uncharacterized protein